jgi:hypothetical protein
VAWRRTERKKPDLGEGDNFIAERLPEPAVDSEADSSGTRRIDGPWDVTWQDLVPWEGIGAVRLMPGCLVHRSDGKQYCGKRERKMSHLLFNFFPTNI